MPLFKNILISLGPMCDADCKVVFTKGKFIIYNPKNSPILTGWRDTEGARLWRIALTPTLEELPVIAENDDQTTLKAYSTYDLPSGEARVCYFHVADGFPDRATWLNAIKAGNYRTWPGITLANATAYCPYVDNYIKGHMVQSQHGFLSTKPKTV